MRWVHPNSQRFAGVTWLQKNECIRYCAFKLKRSHIYSAANGTSRREGSRENLHPRRLVRPHFAGVDCFVTCPRAFLCNVRPPQNNTSPFPPLVMRASTRLEKQHGHLSQVEINEVFRFVRHVAPEIAPDDHMPWRLRMDRTKDAAGERNPSFGFAVQRVSSRHAAYHVGLCFLSNSFLMYAATSCGMRAGDRTEREREK